jgi:hypothetical protein
MAHVLNESKQFCLALSMIEDLIDNNNLCCYFSPMCNIDLRFENLFHLEKAKQVIDQTRTFIIKLCNLIQFTTGVLPHEYSMFHGDPFMVDDYLDYIMLDRTLINGFYGNKTDFNGQFHMEVLFLFIKIIHELSHALTFHCARIYLTDEKDLSIKFETPKTHCLQGESGQSIERLLFGSVIDAYGRKQKEKYIIQYLILSDGRISCVIDTNWIKSFVNDALNLRKLSVIDSILPIQFQFLTKSLKRKLHCQSKSFHRKRTSSKLKILNFDSTDDEYDLTSMTFKS